MRRNILKPVIQIVCGLLLMAGLSACGGGSGDGSGGAGSTSGFQQTYTASASAGEVLSYTFNSVNKTYSYSILKSAYNLANSTGSGSLLANADGTYSPSMFANAKVLAVQGSVVGGQFALQGVGTVPFLGFASPSTTASQIAGTYNYIGISCSPRCFSAFSPGNGDTVFGTMKIDNSLFDPPRYTFCDSANITTNGACTFERRGEIRHKGSGIWRLTNAALNTELDVYFIGMQGPNNQKIGILDDNNSGVILGSGQAIMAQQQNTSMAEVAGSYVYFVQDGTVGFMNLMSNGTTNIGRIFIANALWPGMAVSNSNNGVSYALFSGAGFYVYRDPAVADFTFEIGVKK